MDLIRKSYGKALKKTIAVICLLCLLLSLGAVMASAQGGSITASSCTVERGATASVTFNLQGNPGMFSLVLKVEYDSSAMTLKSVTNGSVFPDSEVVTSSLSANPFTYTGYASGISNITANGSIVTLNFTVSETAAFDSYSVKVKQATGYDDSNNKFAISSSNGNITVVACKHTDKQWHVTVPAGCDTKGTETLICKKCNETLDTRSINATGHKHTEIRNAVAATKTAEGYTGDKYCKDCNKLLSKGSAIAKLKDDTPVVNPGGASHSTSAPSSTKPSVKTPSSTKPSDKTPSSTKPSVSEPVSTSQPVSNPANTTDTTVPSGENKPVITSGADSVFKKNSDASLVFISDADFSEFVRVEVDGNALAENDYTAESGSTIVKVNPAYLSGLSEGEHTLSIISTSGEASTKFTVRNEAGTDSENPETESLAILATIVAVIAVVLVAGAVAFIVIRKRRSK